MRLSIPALLYPTARALGAGTCVAFMADAQWIFSERGAAGQDQKKDPGDEAILRSICFYLFHDHFNVLWIVKVWVHFCGWVDRLDHKYLIYYKNNFPFGGR